LRGGLLFSDKKIQSMKTFIIPAIVLGVALVSCAQSQPKPAANAAGQIQPAMQNGNLSTATFGGGCFWCTEAFFQELRGVASVVSGYSGGKLNNPTYYEVCNGKTGHAEAIQVRFDPAVISYEQLLQVFFTTHDPTTLNRQGADVGTQYRSVIFFHDEAQRSTAEKAKREFAPTIWSGAIVTEITAFEKFFDAESNHQNYFQENPEAGYCQIVINPKVQKFRKQYAAWLKD
jgi:peptide-methionine (S)-S-oxide reductase